MFERDRRRQPRDGRDVVREHLGLGRQQEHVVEREPLLAELPLERDEPLELLLPELGLHHATLAASADGDQATSMPSALSRSRSTCARRRRRPSPSQIESASATTRSRLRLLSPAWRAPRPEAVRVPMRNSMKSVVSAARRPRRTAASASASRPPRGERRPRCMSRNTKLTKSSCPVRLAGSFVPVANLVEPALLVQQCRETERRGGVVRRSPIPSRTASPSRKTRSAAESSPASHSVWATPIAIAPALWRRPASVIRLEGPGDELARTGEVALHRVQAPDDPTLPRLLERPCPAPRARMRSIESSTGSGT